MFQYPINMSKTPLPNPREQVTDEDVQVLEDVAEAFDDEFGAAARAILQSLEDDDPEASNS